VLKISLYFCADKVSLVTTIKHLGIDKTEEFTNQCKSQPVPSPDKDRGFGDRKSIRPVKHPSSKKMCLKTNRYQTMIGHPPC